MVPYVAHYFEHLTDTLRSLQSVSIEAGKVDEARAAANLLLSKIHGAIGFRICDGTGRQLDIYVPVDSIAPGG